MGDPTSAPVRSYRSTNTGLAALLGVANPSPTRTTLNEGATQAPTPLQICPPLSSQAVPAGASVELHCASRHTGEAHAVVDAGQSPTLSHWSWQSIVPDSVV